MRFFIVIVGLSIALAIFVNYRKICKWFGKKVKYSRPIDPVEMADMDLNKHDKEISYGNITVRDDFDPKE